MMPLRATRQFPVFNHAVFRPRAGNSGRLYWCITKNSSRQYTFWRAKVNVFFGFVEFYPTFFVVLQNFQRLWLIIRHNGQKKPRIGDVLVVKTTPVWRAVVSPRFRSPIFGLRRWITGWLEFLKNFDKIGRFSTGNINRWNSAVYKTFGTWPHFSGRNLQDFSSQSSRFLLEICSQTFWRVWNLLKNLDKTGALR